MSMPPVGQNFSCASGPYSDFSIGTPPAASAGKNFRKVKPDSSAAMASLAVATPGNSVMPAPCAPSASFCVRPGDTANWAPASRTA
ncbi:hypothetical protein D3C72_1991660 [compost metagenome]